MTLTYRNLEFFLERNESNYQIVLKSPSGGKEIFKFNFPFSELELENFLLRMGQARRGMRRIESPQLQSARTFGTKLFEAVFNDQVKEYYQNALEASEREGLGVRLLFELSKAPELVNIPWEYLYDPSLARFLAMSVETPVIRYRDIPRQMLPLKVKLPLRILVMVSSPREFPQLDVEAEWKILNSALSDLIKSGQVSLTRMEEPTLLALQQTLRREEYHIFHFIGHGTFSEYREDGLLLMEDERGAGAPVSGHYLGTLLHDEGSLQLAVLNACEGARTSASDPYAGVAQQLVRQGIPAVIAMQFEISERTAVIFSREFYRSLSDNYPVDSALGEARKAIYIQGGDIEWGIPVLYMRARSGQLFDVEAAGVFRSAPSSGEESKPAAARSEAGEINVSIQGDVDGQLAVGNNLTQISNSDDDSEE